MLTLLFSPGTVIDGWISGDLNGPDGFSGAGWTGRGPVFPACPRLGVSPGLPREGTAGLGNPCNNPVFSVFPSPTEDIGPVGAGAAGAPGKDAFGASGATFLGISTPDGFCPDFKLVISSPIVLIEDLYSWTGEGFGGMGEVGCGRGGIGGVGVPVPILPSR